MILKTSKKTSGIMSRGFLKKFFLNCNIKVKANTFLDGTGNCNLIIITTVRDISCQFI